MRKSVLLFAGLFMFASLVIAQEKKLSVSVKPVPSIVKQGENGTLVVTCDVADGFHVSDVSSGMFSVKPFTVNGIEFAEPVYPKADKDAVAGYVYRGKIEIKVPFKVKANSAVKKYILKTKVSFQPCTEDGTVCYPPDDAAGSTELIVKEGSGAVSASDNSQQEIINFESNDESIAGRLNNALNKGSLMAFLIVFLGGLLTSLTPCVYPMIPITIAVIGAQASGGKLKGFILSLFYVLGIAVTFTSLGVLAAKTGAMFGTFAQHPAALIVISLIFFLMGLSMLGAFIIQVPSSISSKLRGKKKKGFLGAFLTGLIAGIVVSPCVSPLLVVILTWVARTGSVVLGASLLFTFSLGLGVLFILIGTFSGVLKALPKSGTWMEYIEKGFGLLLIALALFFVKNAVSPFIYSMLWALLLIVGSVFMGAFAPVHSDSVGKEKVKKAIGIIFLLTGSLIMLFSMGEKMGYAEMKSSGSHVSGESSMWYSSDTIGLQNAAETGKPVIIDFYAEWCAACKELDEKTWPKPDVSKELEKYVPVKLDMTANDEGIKILQKKYKIVGMPTVIIMSPDGKELYRFEGFKGPEEVLNILKKFTK
ncbi:protein-disulfide reductase DsbD [bacterium]|nr:protein-disulfide reductase DsbD [bacterium]